MTIFSNNLSAKMSWLLMFLEEPDKTMWNCAIKCAIRSPLSKWLLFPPFKLTGNKCFVPRVTSPQCSPPTKWLVILVSALSFLSGWEKTHQEEKMTEYFRSLNFIWLSGKLVDIVNIGSRLNYFLHLSASRMK